MCILGYSGKVTKNTLLSTIKNFGPEYKVVADIIVHSAGRGWQNIIHFTSSRNDFVIDCCNIEDRAPAIFYHSSGILRLAGAVGSRTYYFDYNIILEKWYNIKIVQEQKNKRVSELLNTLYITLFYMGQR